MGRLVSEEETLVGQTLFKAEYTFDDFSNRASMAVTGLNAYTVNYTYKLNNRLLTEVQTAGNQSVTTSYTYDAAGNQKTKTSTNPDVPAETRAYTASGQLAAVNIGTTYTAYSYWPSGLRLSKGADAFVWDGANLAYESETQTYYLYGTSLYAAQEGSAERYYLFNGHGDVVQLANSAGTVTKTYEYDAYGNEKNPDSADSNHLRYCGEYYDTEAGTYYLRARYYNPRIGRFVSEDPARSGLNWYTYCAGNPITYIDPSGYTIYLPGDEKDNDIILEMLQKTTDYLILSTDKDKEDNIYVVYDKENFKTDNPKLTSENTLLRELIDNEEYHLAIIIDTSKDSNSFDPYNPTYNGVSYDGLVKINPEDGVISNIIGTKGVVEEIVPSYLMLAHELIHARRHMLGLYIKKSIKGEYYVDYLVRKNWGLAGFFNFSPTKYRYERKQYSVNAPLEELYTVGLLDSGNTNEITENMIRAERGLRPRKYYG